MPYTSTVRQFIVDEFLPDVRPDQLDRGFDLIENGVIDSLGLLKVIAWLEGHFNTSIDVVEMVPENFCSVDAICSFLGRAQVAAIPSPAMTETAATAR